MIERKVEKMARKKEVKDVEEVKKIEEKEVIPVATAKKKCGPKWVTPLIVILVIVGTLFGILWFTGSPKAVTTRAVDRVYNEARDDLKELERLWKKFDLKKPFKGTFSMTIESDMDELEEVDGLTFSGSFGFDAEEEVMIIEGEIENEKSLKGAMAINGKKAYVKLLDEVIDVTEGSDIDPRFFKEFAEAINDVDPDDRGVDYEDEKDWKDFY